MVLNHGVVGLALVEELIADLVESVTDEPPSKRFKVASACEPKQGQGQGAEQEMNRNTLVMPQSVDDMDTDTTQSSPDRSPHDTDTGVLDWCAEDDSCMATDSSIQEPESGTVFGFHRYIHYVIVTPELTRTLQENNKENHTKFPRQLLNQR